jgi:hypothetical protein
MFAIRVMTYHVNRCRGRDGNTDPQRIFEVIRHGAPDLVALQDVNSGKDPEQLAFLSQRLGMKCYGGDHPGANGFLSYFPLKGVQDNYLEGGGSCLQADLDVGGKRLHVFNLRLAGFPFRRRRQIRTLLGPDLLGKGSLGCPLLVIGDFADFVWGIRPDFPCSVVIEGICETGSGSNRPLCSAGHPPAMPPPTCQSSTPFVSRIPANICASTILITIGLK